MSAQRTGGAEGAHPAPHDAHVLARDAHRAALLAARAASEARGAASRAAVAASLAERPPLPVGPSTRAVATAMLRRAGERVTPRAVAGAARALRFAAEARGRRVLRGFKPRHRHPPRLSAPHPWRPLTEREWRWLWPTLEQFCEREEGRPPGHDLFTRFDAVLEACTQDTPWRALRLSTHPNLKPDTVHRTFRRWAQRGLWLRLLVRLAEEQPDLPELEYFICRAYRRAWRVQGLRGVMVARLTGLASALRAPFHRFPDPALSRKAHARVILPFLQREASLPEYVDEAASRLCHRLLRLVAGVKRIRRCWAPA